MTKNRVTYLAAALLLSLCCCLSFPQHALANEESNLLAKGIETITVGEDAPAKTEVVSNLGSYEEAQEYTDGLSPNQLSHVLIQAELIDGTPHYSVWIYAEQQIPSTEDTGDSSDSISLYSNASLESTLVSAWSNLEEWVDVSSFGVSQDSFLNVYAEVVGDHPDMFNARIAYSFPSSGWNGYIKPAYLTSDPAEYKTMKAAYESRVASALATVPDGASELKRAYLLHNWLVENASYNYSAVYNPSTYPQSFTSYGCMAEQAGVCQSYALALADLYKRSGLTCATLFVVTSNHAWNMVVVDGSWYHVDSTWDDQDESYKYFMLSDSAIRLLDSTHTNWEDSANCGWNSSMIASNTQYDDYDWASFGLTAEKTKVMHRLYNPNSGEHFYTASVSEYAGLKTAGWKDEGIGWIAPASSETPVYRLYSGTDHHYTTSTKERDELIAIGWKSEGIGWYSDDSKGQALYRQYNPNVNPKAKRNNSGSHNYTTSQEENNQLVQLGWRAEGIGWYGLNV